MKFILLALAVIAVFGCISAESPPQPQILPYPRCNMRCNRMYAPICGVRFYNGRVETLTHSNQCMYDLYNCENPRTPYYQLFEEGDCISKGYPPVGIVPV